MRPGTAVLRHSLRISGLAPVAVSCLVCTVGVAWLTHSRDGDPPITFIRLCAVVLAASVAGAVGDVVGVLSDACPVGRTRQWALRVVPALALLVTGWGCFAVAVTVAQPAGYDAPPWVGLTVELAAYTAVALAGAAWRARQHPEDGLVAGAAAVAALALLSALPLRPRWWTLGSYPGAPDWAAVHWRWAAVAVVAGLLAAWWFGDPARRPLRRPGSEQPVSRMGQPGEALSRTAAATAGATDASNTLGTM